MKSQLIAQHAHLTSSRKLVKQKYTGTAQLAYYIFEGILTGFTDGRFLCVPAWSGGAAGSRNTAEGKARPCTSAANNPYLYGLMTPTDESYPGGPIPPGSYIVHTPGQHKRMTSCAQLEIPKGLHQVNHRDQFYIHGQGHQGSDGCIVIPSKYFKAVMDRLTQSQGGHLQVFQALDAAFG